MKNRSRWIYFGSLFLFVVFLAVFFLWRNGGTGLQVRTERREEAADTAVPREKVNLNRATAEELMTLPGIGPALAERILSYRRETGGFQSVEELLQVDGIGQGRLEALGDYITVEGEP